MVDACRIDHPTGNSTDPTTGVVSPAYSVAYSGKCKVQSPRGVSSVSSPEAGEHSWDVQSQQVHIPVGAGPVAVDDVVTVTAATYDQQLVGRTYRVAGLANKSMATAQRLIVEEVVG